MRLYKYTNISTANIVLKNKSLRWSSPLIFNDLEECQFTPFTKQQHVDSYNGYIKVLIGASEGRLIYNYDKFSHESNLLINTIRLSREQGAFESRDLTEVMLSATRNPESDYRDFINAAAIKCLRVLCLTSDYDNSLMWAHYGDQHKGCVMELESFYTQKPRSIVEGLVRYHENLQPRSNPLDMLLYGETDEVRDLMIRDVAFSKRTCWSYEKEYRLMFAESFGRVTTTLDMRTHKKDVVVDGQPDQLFTDVDIPIDSIKSVIFGVRAAPEDIKKTLETISKSNYIFDVFQMKIRDGSMVKELIDKAMFLLD